MNNIFCKEGAGTVVNSNDIWNTIPSISCLFGGGGVSRTVEGGQGPGPVIYQLLIISFFFGGGGVSGYGGPGVSSHKFWNNILLIIFFVFFRGRVIDG